MQQLPIVIECPTCGEQYIISRLANNPSEHAVWYSDGYFLDKEIWRTPSIIGCVTCELGFFPENGKRIDVPDWDTFSENWSQTKKAEPPTAGSLALELRARKKMDIETERKIRLEFWYAVNHTEPGRLLLRKNEKFRRFWIESLELLEGLFDEKSSYDRILKAEINRQLGRFESTIGLLQNFNYPSANRILTKAKEKSTELFVL